jgi:hypothetical protein
VAAGFDKADVRRASRHFGLRTWDKPAAACLASRIPYGTAVTIGLLGRIDRAEAALHRLGLRQVRVRHYGDTARLEVELSDIATVIAQRDEVVAAVRGGTATSPSISKGSAAAPERRAVECRSGRRRTESCRAVRWKLCHECSVIGSTPGRPRRPARDERDDSPAAPRRRTGASRGSVRGGGGHRALDVELDVIVVRKIGAGSGRLAMGRSHRARS